MITLIAVHFGLAALAPLLARWIGNRMFWVLAIPPALTFGWLVWQGPTVLAGGEIVERYAWISSLDLDLTLRLGTLQWVLGLVVSGIGALVLLYCRWYFAHDSPKARCAGVLAAFAGTMFGLVTADNFLLFYVFWELTTVFSYLLIGHTPSRAANRGAALNALIVTTFGGLAMLFGIIILGVQIGTFSISETLASAEELASTIDPTSWPPLVIGAVLLILLGAVTKSAIVPFHFWLPGAMAAPTPVSAYLHAAAMVKAGVYLVALLAPVFASVPGWRPVLLGLGAITMVVGGWRALTQNDIKLLLAYGTVSQLGFMVVLCGLGTRSGALAALSVVVAHALFKATLFLVVGVVDHSTGTRDLRKLSRVGRKMPFVAIAAVLAGASMAGVPPLLGFLGKEAALAALLNLRGDLPQFPPGPSLLLVAAVVAGSVMTTAYTLRFLWGAFGDKRGSTIELKVAPVPPGFALAPVVLGLASLAGGFLGPVLSGLFEPYVATVTVGKEGHGLALWQGLTVPLAISGGILVAGVVLFWLQDTIIAMQSGFPSAVSAEGAYLKLMRGVDRLAVEVTAVTQRGSLPLYLGTILLTVVALPGGTLLVMQHWPSRLIWFDSPPQAVVGVVIMVAALAAVGARGRLKAVILLGVTGYGTAMMFLLHGGPDLALTQVLVETVTLIVFVLVMRKLPKYFTDRPLQASRWWRIAVAVSVAVVVCTIVFVSAGSRVAEPISTAYHEVAYTYGYGRNIVNVTLVDIRAWDTLGEISVLVAAATGVASLIFIRTRYLTGTAGVAQRQGRRHVSGTGQRTSGRLSWLRGGEALSPKQRSIIFEVITRLLFPVMVMTSVYVMYVGHESPGGGFAGGLIAGLALMVRYLAGGRNELDEAAPVDAGRVLGAGLLVAGMSALAPLAFGGRVLESYAIDIHIPFLAELQTPFGVLPLLGTWHIVTSLFFDVGVYLVVIGVMLDLARSLGAGIDQHEDEDRAPAVKPDTDEAISGVSRYLAQHPEASAAHGGER
ncbi:Na+/H+ antiporter subunit A [Microlunatus sp. Y2014]|uniref:Na+/H+ antiporter subunit A n=1 Tax=Microlunatus sp. Y2014 TaxID=3418488 RepID=UPI003DA755CA